MLYYCWIELIELICKRLFFGIKHAAGKETETASRWKSAQDNIFLVHNRDESGTQASDPASADQTSDDYHPTDPSQSEPSDQTAENIG